MSCISINTLYSSGLVRNAHNYYPTISIGHCNYGVGKSLRLDMNTLAIESLSFRHLPKFFNRVSHNRYNLFTDRSIIIPLQDYAKIMILIVIQDTDFG